MLFYLFIQLSIPLFLRSSAQGAGVYVPTQLDRSYPLIFRSKGDEKGNRTTVIIDPDQLVQAPGGYGEYRLGALYALYTQEHKDERFIQAAFSQLMGVPLSGVYPYVLSANEALAREISTHVPTAFLRDIAEWVAGREFSKFFDVPARLQEAQKKIHLHSQASTDKSRQFCPIAVLNASGKTGKAAEVSQLLENTQYFIIHTGTVPEIADASTIYRVAGDGGCQSTVDEVTAFFPIQPPVIEEEKSGYTAQYRAKIVLILGRNY